jgi:SpoVK/Ycf46/Vps4 family AAA+-type ATPase
VSDPTPGWAERVPASTTSANNEMMPGVMAIDATVLASIGALVERDPANVALRLHLAELFLSNGQAGEALSHASIVLASRPDDGAALTLAARAAEALGDTARASAYRRLAEAIGEGDAPAPTVPDNDDGTTEAEAGAAPALDPEPAPGRVGLRLVEGNRVDAEPLETEVEAPRIMLRDVAGMETVKHRLNLAFLAPLRNPELRRTFGKSLRGGLLLYGPPGCGKTFIARAVAGELSAKFMAVGIADVLDMWLGQSEQNLKGYFEAARRQAPCVLFFDEVDALGRKRSLMRHGAGSGVISQLLAELDGLQSDNRGVFVLAATNHPWDVDSALRRPGRLDRMLLVLPPDVSAREAILRAHCRDRPLAADVDFAGIAARLDDYSGADVAHLCEAAAEFALEESLNAPAIHPISAAHFKRAMKDVRPSIRPWLESAKNHALFANDGGVYDELLEYLRARRIV